MSSRPSKTASSERGKSLHGEAQPQFGRPFNTRHLRIYVCLSAVVRLNHVSPFKQRLFVCGFNELAEFQSRKISHLVSIANPGAAPPKPSWFNGAHLQLWFGDVISEADAKRCNTSPPSLQDVQ